MNKKIFRLNKNVLKIYPFITILGSNRNYSKTGVKRPFPKRQKIGFQDQLTLNAGQKYSPWSILPLLSHCLSLRSLFCLVLSGHFTVQ